MALVARAIHCQLGSQKPAVVSQEQPAVSPVQIQRLNMGEGENGNNKIVLQPRVCTLRLYGSDKPGVMKLRKEGEDEVSTFFETLSDYIESSKKSQDFEIISGRLAMIVFAATVIEEAVTGNSLFRKIDVEGIAEAGGVCLGAVIFAAIFAWFSSARNRVGRMFTLSCNTLIDSLIDQIVDGLFYESEINDWSDDI
ncbi:stress enhanced protein 2, chloroplastic-like [Mangifera indica]|uniref:stress enhanced protein 2, chloroplastic-like n=1 Tax=Mangifera indica TaxID=29780 RepID=UPI001CF97222|nr:stress enhanced protein 2, chloroplastic-like [Mangifera indica]